jgi:hypothetical protein
MCKHSIVKIGECKVCTKCGMTTLDNGKIIFDREFANYIRQKGKKDGKGKQKQKRTIS